ncbi:MAG: hypothetical protein ACRBDX_01770 [Gammaproteobacteria bacterium]
MSAFGHKKTLKYLQSNYIQNTNTSVFSSTHIAIPNFIFNSQELTPRALVLEHDEHMDKLKDGIDTSSELFHQDIEAVNAIIAMVIFVVIMLVLLLFG